MSIILIGLFSALCLLRVPVSFSLFLSSFLVILMQGNITPSIIAQRIWVGLDSFPLLAVPFFLVVGQLINETILMDRLLNLSHSLVGHIKGGLAHSNVVISMIIAGMSGVSSADTAGIGSVLIPAMIKEGYGKGFTVGVTAASSTLGNIIPPSLMMIVYASCSNLSVGGLFLTGIIPGLMIVVGQMAYSFYYAVKYGIGDIRKFSWQNLFKAAKGSIFAATIPVIIIGGITTGVFTATEASLVAVVYTFFLLFFYREFSFAKFYRVIKFCVEFSSLSLFCIATASIWGWILAYYSIPQAIVAYFDAIGLLSSQLLVFGFVVLLFLAMGTFMDALPAIIIMQPIIGELTLRVGINPYHMGIVVVLTLAIGLITPPYGLCLMIASRLAGISVPEALKSLVPFLIISLIVVLIAIFFPNVMLFIPRLAMQRFIR